MKVNLPKSDEIFSLTPYLLDGHFVARKPFKKDDV
jgi:hypothetical protein